MRNRKARGGNKKKSTTPASIEMPFRDYEILIKNHSIQVYREWIEPERDYENGKQVDYHLDCYIEIRKTEDQFARTLYIYSQYTGKLWSTASLSEANSILNKELNYCNKSMKEENELSRKDSIKKAKEKPALLTA